MQFPLKRVEIFNPSQENQDIRSLFSPVLVGVFFFVFLNPSRCRQKQNQLDTARQATFVPTAGSG